MQYPMSKLNVMPFTGLDPLISKKNGGFLKGTPSSHPSMDFPV